MVNYDLQTDDDIEAGKKLVKEYVASLLPKGAQLSWKPNGAFWYTLIADYSGRISDVFDMEIQDLEDIPGDEEHGVEMKAFAKDAVDDWKAKQLSTAAAP
jgi:hypothetical protein